jgi:signal transduction histidine kinase
MEFIQQLFSTQGFMPHGSCYTWDPYVIWLHVISDGIIALAYYSIPITLVYFVRRRRDLAFNWMFVSFAIFILACGTTHVMEIWSIWHPVYWLSGFVKVITALASITTAIALVPLVPVALVIPGPDELTRTNNALQRAMEEHKQTAERLQRLNEELHRKAAELEQANQELEAFSSSVSHDLRAPLRHIDGFVDLLRQDSGAALGSSSQLYLGIISSSAKRMGTLIDDLLVFSRMGRQEMQDVPVNMNLLVSEVIEEMSPEIGQRQIEWSISRLPIVSGDRSLLKQVWANLISNAVKYSRHRDPAQITITAKEDESEYWFSIQDNGAGFDMRYADKLFGIFQRLHQPEEFEGTGIGLANVRRIVARHGGMTWGEGRVDEGATFCFTLQKRLSLSLTEPPEDFTAFPARV